MTEHAKARAQQRYGLEMTDADVLSVVSKIRSGEAVLQRRVEGTETYLLVYRGVVVRPVYLPATGALVTFLARHQKLANLHWRPRRTKFHAPCRKAKEGRREPKREQV